MFSTSMNIVDTEPHASVLSGRIFINKYTTLYSIISDLELNKIATFNDSWTLEHPGGSLKSLGTKVAVWSLRSLDFFRFF